MEEVKVEEEEPPKPPEPEPVIKKHQEDNKLGQPPVIIVEPPPAPVIQVVERVPEPPPEPIQESYIYRHPYGFIGIGNGTASPIEMEIVTEEVIDIVKPLTFDPMHPGLENLSPR